MDDDDDLIVDDDDGGGILYYYLYYLYSISYIALHASIRLERSCSFTCLLHGRKFSQCKTKSLLYIELHLCNMGNEITMCVEPENEAAERRFWRKEFHGNVDFVDKALPAKHVVNVLHGGGYMLANSPEVIENNFAKKNNKEATLQDLMIDIGSMYGSYKDRKNQWV